MRSRNPTGQAGRASRVVLARKLFLVEDIARQIEHIAPLDAGNAELAEPSRERIHREP